MDPSTLSKTGSSLVVFNWAVPDHAHALVSTTSDLRSCGTSVADCGLWMSVHQATSMTKVLVQ